MERIDSIKSAAQLLVELRHTGRFIARLPETSRPQSTEDALQIQDRIVKVMGDAIGGYKCGVPNAERTTIAPIFAKTIVSTSPCVVQPWNPSAVDIARIEPEIAFVIGKPLPPRAQPYSEEEVREAIAEARCVLELIGSRYRDHTELPFIEQLADCISNQGLFVGPVVPDARGAPGMTTIGEFPLKIEVIATGQILVDKQGRHANGDPLQPLYWLANFLAARGKGLQAGQIVTTGTYAGLIDLPVGTPIRFRYGDLGEFDVEFARAES